MLNVEHLCEPETVGIISTSTGKIYISHRGKHSTDGWVSTKGNARNPFMKNLNIYVLQRSRVCTYISCYSCSFFIAISTPEVQKYIENKID